MSTLLVFCACGNHHRLHQHLVSFRNSSTRPKKTSPPLYVSKVSSNYCYYMPMPPFAASSPCARDKNHALLLVPNAKERNSASGNKKNKKKKKKRGWYWWSNFLSDDDDQIWSDWTADDVLDADGPTQGETDSFESWKRRAEAISELREAQEDARNAESHEWQDWLQDDAASSSFTTTSSSKQRDWGEQVEPSSELMRDTRDLLVEPISKSNDADDDSDDDLLFEDRVFRYASTSSAKFLASLILIPWVLDFLVHDYILMPFLERYVKKVPLAAEFLDVRRHQKLEMIKTLRVERGRFKLEVEIGKSPPLSDEEVWLELRHKAIELRDEWRFKNRKAFANIWSDMVYGISLFILIYSNKSKVALLKFTGYKLLNNISDTGKAFLIILVTDIFLGYHSESGWQALVEIILEHYGLEVDPAVITIFICFVPVVVDACVKLWLFKFLPRLSPNVTNIFREMKRH